MYNIKMENIIYTDQISVKIDDVPSYLKNSDFYNNLNTDDNTDIIVPSKYTKLNESIDNEHDFNHFILTCLFWSIIKLPNFACRYIVSNLSVSKEIIKKHKDTRGLQVFNIFNDTELNMTNLFVFCVKHDDFNLYQELLLIIPFFCDDDFIFAIMKHGNLQFYKHLETKYFKLTTYHVYLAIKHCQNKLFMYMYLSPQFSNIVTTTSYLIGFLQCAIDHDNVEIVKTIFESNSKIKINDCPAQAILNDSVKCLEYFVKYKGYVIGNNNLTDAIYNNSTKCFEYILQFMELDISDANIERICINPNLLKVYCEYCILKRIGLTHTLYNIAYEKSSNYQLGLECTKVLHNYNCPWNKKTSRIAIQNNHFESLKYLHENNCEIDFHTSNIGCRCEEYFYELKYSKCRKSCYVYSATEFLDSYCYNHPCQSKSHLMYFFDDLCTDCFNACTDCFNACANSTMILGRCILTPPCFIGYSCVKACSICELY